jgi:hypothetical protein
MAAQLTDDRRRSELAMAITVAGCSTVVGSAMAAVAIILARHVAVPSVV